MVSLQTFSWCLGWAAFFEPCHRHVKFSTKKKAGQRATTSFHSSILRARRIIFAAIHKEKLKFKVMLSATVLNSVKRKINLLKNGGYFRLTPSNDLNTVPPLITRYSHVIVCFFFSFFFFITFSLQADYKVFVFVFCFDCGLTSR